MPRALAPVPSRAKPVARAWARMRASGEGYLEFALDQPGLSRTVFSASGKHPAQPAAASAGDEAADATGPFQHLADAVDELVEVAAIPPSRRPRTELVARSVVHGIATLALDGPLRGTSREDVFAIVARPAEVLEDGA